MSRPANEKLMCNPDEILAFWYDPAQAACWFDATPALDDVIRARFEPVWAAAAAGQFQDWQHSPEGCLALCIVLDQFPLNMFRGQARSFSTEQQAVAVARQAVARGFDARLPQDRRLFLYLPFMHSENLADQDESVRLFEAAGLAQGAHFARHHRDIIRRFGRFPHRNLPLDRTSTPAEQAYLASPEAFRG